MALENHNSVLQSQTFQSITPAAGAAVPSHPTSAAVPTGAVANSGQSVHVRGIEKRRSPRYKCEGSVEMREEGRDTQTWATFTDISLHGCYVEATATHPVGTALRMKLSANGFEVTTKGNVRVSYPSLGMGIAFSEMSAQDRSRLKELLQTISRPSVILGPGITSSVPIALGVASLPQIFNPGVGLQAVIQFFENRQMLMRDEFLRILRNSQKVEDKQGS